VKRGLWLALFIALTISGCWFVRGKLRGETQSTYPAPGPIVPKAARIYSYVNSAPTSLTANPISSITTGTYTCAAGDALFFDVYLESGIGAGHSLTAATTTGTNTVTASALFQNNFVSASNGNYTGIFAVLKCDGSAGTFTFTNSLNNGNAITVTQVEYAYTGGGTATFDTAQPCNSGNCPNIAPSHIGELLLNFTGSNTGLPGSVAGWATRLQTGTAPLAQMSASDIAIASAGATAQPVGANAVLGLTAAFK
jgi:hypothetical protein